MEGGTAKRGGGGRDRGRGGGGRGQGGQGGRGRGGGGGRGGGRGQGGSGRGKQGSSGRGGSADRGRGQGQGGHMGGGHMDYFTFLRTALESERTLSREGEVEEFVDMLAKHWDPEELAGKLTDKKYNGIDRLRDLLGRDVHVSTESYAATPSSPTLSFQRSILPLVNILTKSEIRKAVISQRSNVLYASLHAMNGLELRLARLAQQCLEMGDEGLIMGARSGSREALRQLWPRTSVDVLLPIVYLMREVVNRVEDAAAKPEFREALRALQACLELCKERAGYNEGDLTVVEDVLHGINLRVENVESRLRLGDERTRAAEVERLRQAAYATPRASKSLVRDGPGELSREGQPRHDNDHIGIEHIAINPTSNELLSEKSPFLPPNDGSFGAVGGEERDLITASQRHLEVHFRLLRHEMVGPLQEGLQTLIDQVLSKKGGSKKSKKEKGSTLALRSANTMSYLLRGAKLVSCSGHPVFGIYFEMTFEQPSALGGLTRGRRQEFWERKKLLMNDSLVLIVGQEQGGGSGGWCIVPCTVVERDVSKLMRDQPVVGLACSLEGSMGEGNFQQLIDWMLRDQRGQDGAGSLFLLQVQANYVGTAPVLRSLQQMARSGASIPLAPHILPGSGEAALDSLVDMVPQYLQKKRFLDLTCLARDPSTLNDADVDALSDVDTNDPDAFPLEELLRSSTLELSQAEAIRTMLSRPVALMQGPPGSGKTYIGAKVVEVLVKNFHDDSHPYGTPSVKALPLLCVCLTNHALDQFLESLLDAGIDGIVRIGGGCKSERLEPLNIRNIRADTSRDLLKQRYDLKDELKDMEQDLDKCHRIINAGALSYASAANYLPRDLLKSFTDPMDEGGYMPASLDGKSLEQRWKLWRDGHDPFHIWQPASGSGGGGQGVEEMKAGGTDAAAAGQVEEGHGVAAGRRQSKKAQQAGMKAWLMVPKKRKGLYHSVKQRLQQDAQQTVEDIAQKYRMMHQELRSIQERMDLEKLQDATVVGLTTTGASKHQHLLRRLGAKVIVVEEAAEVLEAHVLACLSDSVEHLILIGDHLQLRPKVENYQLTAVSGRGFNLDISLFERLATQRGNDIVQLKQQRRMRPEIADLIRLEVYPDLEDHPSLAAYPPVSGMRASLFFCEHDVPEDAYAGGVLDDNLSKSNKHEVEMAVCLTSYLLKQGYGAGEITVITPYLKQLHLLRQALSKIVVTYTDERDEEALETLMEGEDETEAGAQGGKRQRAGTPVSEGSALYRASAKDRVRMATIDNFQGEESTVVVISLVRSNPDGRIGFLKMANRVNVLLSRAKHGMYIIGNPETLRARPEGNIWPAILDCLEARGQLGPGFPLVCSAHPNHTLDAARPEDFVQVQNGGCSTPCQQRMPCGHVCPLMCHPKVDTGHEDVPCSEPCPRLCPRRHVCKKACGEVCGNCVVPVPLSEPLPCGHRRETVPCHLLESLERVICKVPTVVKYEGCMHEVKVECRKAAAARSHCPAACGKELPCGHPCGQSCASCKTHRGDEAPVCNEVCDKPMLCGHSCALICHAASTPCECKEPCGQRCEHSACDRGCGVVCTPCAMECTWGACEHHGACHMPCGAPCDRPPCGERCSKLLACGHRCPSVCSEPCPSADFCQLCASQVLKERVVDLIMFATYEDHDLEEEPVIVLGCGHVYALSSLDQHVGLTNSYAEDGTPLPFAAEFTRVPTCPDCRSPIVSVKRYGRPVKKALIGSLMERFVLLSRQQLGTAVEMLQEASGDANTELSSKALKRVKDAKKAFLRVARQVAPTQQVYEASVAAAQRAGIPDDAAARMIVPPPPDDVCDKANVYAEKAEALLIKHQLSVWQKEAKDDDEKRAAPRKAAQRTNQLEQRLENVLKEAKESRHLQTAASAAFELAHVLATLGLEVRQGNETEKEDAKTRVRDLCSYLEEHELQSMRTEFGQRAAQLRRMITDISREELRDIITAMGHGAYHGYGYQQNLGRGHMYTCPNGHLYFIGECGQAMEGGRCPECGAAIGGGDHQLRQDNRHADEHWRRAYG